MNQRIVSDLRDCYFENLRDFEFLLMYRGVPFIAKTRLVNVSEQEATFEVQSPEGVLFELGRPAVLLRDELGDPVKCRIVSFDLASRNLVMGEFDYSTEQIGKRAEYRVEPLPPLEAIILAAGKEIPGFLVDLSPSGAGVVVAVYDAGEHCPVGAEVVLRMTLSESPVTLPSVVRYTECRGNDLRLALVFAANAPHKNSVMRYVIRQQMEIRAEVEKMYQSRMGGVGEV